MAFVKLVKNKAYFMRYQTKFKRRREGRTDYYARRRLVLQDKDKYNTPKYRLVGRITSTRAIAQVVYATLQGDKIFCAADSQELRKYGLTAGLSNYASAYATGLLLARRLLKKVGLDAAYKGAEKADGKHFLVEEGADRRPFKAILDVGLRATSNGSKIFAILKGACDGGLYVPHSPNKFPGAKKEGDDNKDGHKIHRTRIFGAHVDGWINKLKTNKNRYDLQFSKWQKTLADAKVDSVEKLYTKIHEEIKKNPEFTKKPVKQTPKRDFTKKITKRLNAVERRKRVQAKINIVLKQAAKKSKK